MPRKRNYTPYEKLRGKITFGVTEFESIRYVTKIVPASDGLSASAHCMGTRLIPMSLPRLNCLENNSENR